VSHAQALARNSKAKQMPHVSKTNKCPFSLNPGKKKKKKRKKKKQNQNFEILWIAQRGKS